MSDWVGRGGGGLCLKIGESLAMQRGQAGLGKRKSCNLNFVETCQGKIRKK